MRNVGTGFESFLEPTRIWLFGKPFTSLTYNTTSMATPQGGAPQARMGHLYRPPLSANLAHAPSADRA